MREYTRNLGGEEPIEEKAGEEGAVYLTTEGFDTRRTPPATVSRGVPRTGGIRHRSGWAGGETGAPEQRAWQEGPVMGRCSGRAAGLVDLPYAHVCICGSDLQTERKQSSNQASKSKRDIQTAAGGQEEDEAAFLACMKRETVMRCETCVWVCRVGFEAVMWGQKQEKSKRASPNGSVGGKKKSPSMAWHDSSYFSASQQSAVSSQLEDWQAAN